MKNLQQYGISFLLIFIFSLKVMAPVFAGNHFLEKADVEQQQEKSAEEKTTDKSLIYEFELSDLITLQQSALSRFFNACLYSILKPLFLPVQYFAIPTPPPWAKR